MPVNKIFRSSSVCVITWIQWNYFNDWLYLCIPLRVTGKSSENECIQRLCMCGKTTPGMYLVVRILKAQFLYPKGRMTIVFKMKIPRLWSS